MNVVFDLGGVVFRWQPDLIIRRVFENAETQGLVKRQIFEHPDWIELDRGTIPLEQAIVRAAARTGLERKDVETLFAEVPPSLTPVEETIDLVRALKRSGHPLYVLSNMSVASITHLESSYDIWDLFDGAVISCRIRKVKPDIAIFRHLLTEYRLQADETIFIDDVADNVIAASSIGIRTIRFSDPGQCRRELAMLIQNLSENR